MIVAGWIIVGIAILCFITGLKCIFDVQMLRAEAGDIALWGLRRPWNWLKRIGFVSNHIVKFIKSVKQRKGDTVENLRSEARHTAVEAAGWFATSAFFTSIGGILINLGNTG